LFDLKECFCETERLENVQKVNGNGLVHYSHGFYDLHQLGP